MAALERLLFVSAFSAPFQKVNMVRLLTSVLKGQKSYRSVEASPPTTHTQPVLTTFRADTPLKSAGFNNFTARLHSWSTRGKQAPEKKSG